MMIFRRLTAFPSRMASMRFRILSKKYASYHGKKDYLVEPRATVPNSYIIGIADRIFSALDINDIEKEDVKKLITPFRYSLAIPNERLIFDLIKGFNYWLKLPSDVIDIVGQLYVTTYEAGIMLDDVIDGSDYRRTLPTPLKLFGTYRSIICNQACFFLCLKNLMKLNNEKIAEVYVDSIIKYFTGLYKEAEYIENKICPTVNEYEQICLSKCDGVTGLLLKFMQAFSDCTTDFSVVSELLSIHMQYSNDIANLCEPSSWKAKAFCEDFSEGKFTLASIHAVSSNTFEGDIVFNIICSKTTDLPTLRYCLSLLEKLGSIDFARKMTTSVENKMREEIKILGGNPLLVEYLDTFIAWTNDERYPDTKDTIIE